MATTIELLMLTTAMGDTDDDVYQAVCESVNTSRHSSGVLTARMLRGTNLTGFIIEGSEDGQTFAEIAKLSAPGLTTKYLNRTEPPERTDKRLWKIIRWRIDPSGTPTNEWEFCGRATLVLK
jgi:hypothetical protein